jgi:hypothetical protein
MTLRDHGQEFADNRKLWDAWTSIHTTSVPPLKGASGGVEV